MRLQILINHYNESPAIVGKMLQSIAEQTGCAPHSDYSVIIASDGADNAIDADFFNSFPFDIQYSVLEHSGTRATRNALLDMATAEYVMFCDADDCFKRPDGISTLLNATKDGADIVNSLFDVEIKDGDSFRYSKVPANAIWLHGKIFRREYLTGNHIRFDEIANHGDMSFLWLAFHLTKNIQLVPDSFYVWKYNEHSTTRDDPFFVVRTYSKMLLSYSRLADDLIWRERRDLYGELISEVFPLVYVDTKMCNWDNAPPQYVDDAKKAVSDFIRSYREDYKSLDEKFRKMKYSAVLVMKRTYGSPGGFYAFNAWVGKF